MKKMNKKAWLRIVEAVAAVLIIFGVVMIIVSKQVPKPDSSEEIYDKQKQILDIVSNNESLRNFILIENKDPVKNSISKLIPNNWNFTINICNLTMICNAETPGDREIFVAESLVTSNLTQYQPKKIRFFVWIK
jgi:hypothetical protein